MGPRAMVCAGLAGVGERPMASVATAIATSGACRSNSIPDDLCRARSRHQQLPASDRAAHRRRLSRHRRVLPHHPPRRRRRRVAPHQRGGGRRAVEALQVCRDKMHARGVMRARLIATAACRAAENGEEFRSRVAREAGLELEIIDSATEARLAATGCTELFDPSASGVILFDIGGGSSELVRLNRPPGNRPARAADARHRGLGLAAGRRRHARRALRRQCRVARHLRRDGGGGRCVRRTNSQPTIATSTASTRSARRAR